MAKQLNVSLNVQANTRDAKRNLEDLSSILNKISVATKLDVNDQSLKEAKQAAIDLQQHLSKAVNVDTGKLDLNKFSQSLSKAGQNLQQLHSKLTKLGPDGQQAFLRLAQSIAQADSSTLSLGAKLSQLGTTLKNTARWQISSSILHGFMGAIQGAYGYAQDLNKSLNNIRIVTGQSIDQMAQFADEANRAAKALSTTTTSYTDAALIYYQQGLTGKAVTERTEATIKLANVSRQSAEEVSSQMTAIWNNFDDGSKKLEYYADVITALGAATASSSDEIAQGLQKFAAVADTVGLSYEKATAALATVVAETRQSADVVGTAFKTMFARFQGVTLGETLEDGVGLNKYSKALETVGVNILEANGNLKDMDTILDELGAKWNQIGNAQQVALAETVAGTRQYAQFMAIMENYDKILANQKLGEGSEGTLQKQADIYAESWEAAGKRVKAAAQSIYSDLLDDKFFISLLNGFEKFLTGIHNVIEGFGGLKGILLLVSSIFMTHFAKEIPAKLADLTSNIRILNGAAEKSKQVLLDQTSSIMQTSTFIDKTNHALSAEAQIISTTTKMTAELNEKRKELSKTEIAAYESKIRLVQAYGQQTIAIGENIDAIRREAAELSRQVKSSLMSQGTWNPNLTGQINTKTAELQALQNQNQSLGLQKANSQRTIDALSGKQNLTKEENQLLFGAQSKNGALSRIIDENREKIKLLKEEIQQLKNTMAQDNGQTLFKKLELSTAEYGKMQSAIEQVQQGYSRLQDTFDQGKETEVKEKIENYIKVLKDAGFNVDEIVSKLQSNDLAGALDIFRTIDEANIDGSVGQQFVEKWVEIENIADNLIARGADKTVVTKLVEDLKAANITEEEFKRRTSELNGELSKIEGHTMQFSEALGTMVGTITQLAMGISALKRIGNIWSDEDLSTGEKLLQTATSLSMIMPILTTVLNRQKIADLSAAAAKMLHMTAINKERTAEGLLIPVKIASGEASYFALGPLLIFVGIAAAVIGAIVAITNALKGHGDRLKTLKQSQEDFNDATEEATNKWNTLKDTIANYKKAYDGISQLTAGTQEFIDAIKEANDEANNLINDLRLVFGEDYIYDKNGAIMFTSIGNQKIEEANAKGKIASDYASYTDIYNREQISKEEYNRKQNSIKGYYSQASANWSEYRDFASAYDWSLLSGDIALKSAEDISKLLQARSTEGGALSTEAFLKQYGYLSSDEDHEYDEETADAIKNILVPEIEKLMEQGIVTEAPEGYHAYDQYIEDYSRLNASILQNTGLNGNILAQQYMMSQEITEDLINDYANKHYTQENDARNKLINEMGLSEDQIAGAEKTFGSVSKYLAFLEFMTDKQNDLTSKITSVDDLLKGDKNKDLFVKILSGQVSQISPEEMKKIASGEFDNNTVLKSALEVLFPDKDLKAVLQEEIGDYNVADFYRTQLKGVDATRESIKNLNKELGSLKLGDTIDPKVYQELSSNLQSYFTLMEDETYKLIGDAEQLNAALFREKVSGFENDLSYYDQISNTQRTMEGVGYDLQFNNLTVEEAKQRDATAIAYAMTADSLQQLNQVKEKFNELNVPEITQTLAINEALQDLATKYTTCTDELRDFQAALATNNRELIENKQEALEYSINTAELAETMSLSVDDIEDQARAFLDTEESIKQLVDKEQDQQKVATKMAALNQSMNKGVTTLSKNWETWKKTLAESDKTSMDYIDTVQDMKKVLKDLVGVVDEDFIPDDFFDNIKTDENLMTLMDQAAQGDAKSINLLGTALAKASVESMNFAEGMNVSNAAFLANSGSDLTSMFEATMASSEEVFNYYRDNVLEGITALETAIQDGTLQAGQDIAALMDGTGASWVDSLNAMAIATGMSVSEMRSMLNSLGIEAEIGVKEETVHQKIPKYYTRTRITELGDPATGNGRVVETSTWQDGYDEVDGVMEVAQINMGAENAGKQPKTIRYTGRSAPSVSSYKQDTGGKGGGSTKSNTKSVEEHIDEEHRYDELNKQLEGLSKQYDRLGKARDRAWGKNKIALLEQELEKLKQMQKVYERYLQTVAGDNWKNLHDTLQSGGNVGALIAAGRAGGYLQKDFDKLISAAKGGIEYKGKNENGEEQLFHIDWQGLKDTFNIDLLLNEFGEIANKDDIEEAIEAWWNNHIDDINELEDGDEKTRQKAELEAIKDYAKKALDQYADSVNTFTENSDKLLDNFYDQQDKFYENFRYKIDLKVEISERSLKRIEYAIKILGDNIYKVPEVMQAWFDERVKNTKDEVETMGTTWTKAYEDATAAHDQGLISDEDYIQTIKDAQDGLYGCIDSLLEINDEMREYYKNVLSKVKDEMARITDEMDHQLDTINHLTNVLSLLGRETDYAAIGKILDAQLQMSRNGYDVSKAQVEMYRRQVEAAQTELEQFVMEGISEEALEEWKNAVLYPAQEALREAESEMEADFEQYLEVIKARYENNINRIYQDSERRLAGRWGSFDELNKAMERQHALDDEYLTKTNQIYETNVLLKKLAQDLDKTNNNAAKTRIKNFSAEIEELQQKNKLSKSELDIAKARYEMLLAENALEDARNAKSTVRLQRDNEGNYGYVYTADSDKITAAEDEFEQKRNDLYNLVLGQANDYTEKIIQLNQQAYSELKELDLAYAEGRIADEDTYNRLRQDIIDKYNDLIQEDYESYYRALGWLDVTASTDHTEAWGTSFADILDLEEDFKGETSQVIQETGAEISELSALRAEATEEAKVGNGELEKQLGELTKANDDLAREMIDRVVPSAEETLSMAQQLTAEWIRQYSAIMNLVSGYMALATAMNQTMSDMSGVADEGTGGLGFDPDFDYANAMRNWLLNGGSKDDEQYKQWEREREAKIDSMGLSQDYYGYRGDEFQNKLDTYIENDLEGYTIADAVDAFEQAGENLEQVSEQLNQLTSYGTGGFTGNWGSRGKLAVLHEKELVLNPADTENMLSAVGMLREFSSAIDLRAAASNLSGGLNSPNYEPGAQVVEQEVTIHAEFPNVTNHSEIEEAFNSLINRASQYASRY